LLITYNSYRIIPVLDLVDVFVFIPKNNYSNLIPTRNGYLEFDPIVGWEEKYKQMHHRENQLYDETMFNAIVCELELENSNFTCKKSQRS
jgi:hypothetical protein